MKGWRKPKAFAAAYSAQKRFLAFVLTLAMIFTSVGTDLNVSYAAQGNKVDFEIYGSDLVNAINEAVESDNVVKPDSLEFTNGAIDKFETLFYGEGKVYEVYPQIDGGDMDAELRVFVRLPEDADDMYMVTGDEEVIFLYVNNGDETISCATRIIRSVDGEEKVKTTKRINVKSYEDKFGDEEVDIVSKKDETVEETTASEEKSQDTATDAASEETTAAEEKETEITDETAEATEEETTEAAEENTEAETEEATEAEKETEAETEKETAEETEKETAEEKVDAEGEVTASLSRHYAPVVAMKEDAQAEPEKETAEAAETEKEVVETEKETTEAVEKGTAEAVETEKETTEAETKDAEVTETETAAETSETEETAEDASKEETAAESKENEETEETKETVAETSKAAETTAEAKEEENKKADAATDSDLVGIGYCSTAKAYTTTVKALKALDDVQGLKVTYAINPEYSARIVDGQRGVEEGNDLVFGVKNQIGYAIETVTANGEFLEADSTTENEDGSVTAWYTVPEVTEEQEIEVYMTETDAHPEFNAELTMEDGTVITLHAAEGVLPAGVTAEATVKDDLADAVKEKLEAEDTDKGAVKAVVAYDINLMLNDSKLDNNWSQNGSVEVTFSGSKIQNMMSDAAVVEVYANKSSDEEALTTETTDDLNLEHILTEEITDSENENVTFEAKHFSEYIQVAREAKKTKSLNVIYHSNNKWWESDVISKYSQKAGDVITFPEYTGDKGTFGDDWHFVGWSTDSQANEAGDGHYTQTVYRPGDTYRIPDDRQNDIDFYAIWAQKNVKANFYIRLDGKIPTEPQKHAGSDYTAGITIQGALKSAAFYTNSTEGVGSQLAKRPTESQIRDRLRAKGINYNSETQYILWYVIKYENDGGTNYNWHVDGVLLDKEKVNLAYSPNCNTGEWVSDTMPDGSQYIMGTEATVSNKIPKRHGYTFVGWNTAADGTGTSYAPNDRFTINENTTLYAQWLEKGSVLLKYIANAGGSVSKRSESVAPATGNPQGSEATPASGYRFVNWTLGDTDTEVSRRNNLTKDVIDQHAKSKENLYVATTFKANFERDPEQAATVSYKFRHNNSGYDVEIPDAIKQAPTDNVTYYVGESVKVKETGTKERIDVNGGYWTLDGSAWTLNGVHYAAGTEVAVTSENRQSLDFMAVWTFHKTSVIYYVSVGQGTVERANETVDQNGKALGSVATPINNNYRFEGWYTSGACNAQDKITNAGANFKPVTPVGGWPESTTYYAKFVPSTVNYAVHYYLEGTEKALAEDVNASGNFGYPATGTAKDIAGYELVDPTETTKTITLAADNNVIIFYYKEKNDVTITYKVAAGQATAGTVTTENDKEVDVAYEVVKPATGKATGATAIAKDGYYFVNWTVGEDGAIVGTDAVLTPEQVDAVAHKTGIYEATTFVAHFRKELVIRTISDEKVYDGQPLTAKHAGYTYSPSALAVGDKLEVELNGSQTNVGKSYNTVASVKVMRGDRNVTSEYQWRKEENGILKVKKRDVTLLSANADKTYDGIPLTKKVVNIKAGSFADGEGIKAYDVTGSQLNVGHCDNKYTYELKDNTNAANYNIITEYGQLTVKQDNREITVTAESYKREYDGTAIEYPKYSVSGEEVLTAGAKAAGHYLDVVVASKGGKQVGVGKTANEVKVCRVLDRDGNDVSANYNLKTVDGTLEVTPRKITLTSASAWKYYDGKPLTAKTVEVTSGSFVTGEGAIYNVTGSQTNADPEPGKNIFTYKMDEHTVAANYDVTVKYGTLRVLKDEKTIALKANSDEKVYNGFPLTNNGWQLIGTLAAGDKVSDVVVTGSQTVKGISDNEITSYKITNAKGEDVTGNYNLGENEKGTLTVTARPITITAASDSKEYDGTPLTANRYSVSENGLADSDEISAITIDGSQIEIGTSSNAVRAGSVKITKKAEAANSRSTAEDVTGNYNIKLEEGILKVTNRNDLSYIVNYHYLDAKGKEVDVESVIKDNAFIGEAIAYSDAASRDHAGKTYALVRVDNAGKAVEYYADGAENPNVVDVYYGLDEIGTNIEKPKTPDGIPDMYQVVFRYISENPSYGTVDGVAVVDGYVMEVVTRPQKADGSYDMDAEVYPLGNVTVTGIGNYTFNHWSDSDTNYANANEIAGHGFKSDMTFVAHFSYDGGNNNNNNGGGNGGNGGGNGGSGSTSGGGSSSSGSRGTITVTSGGPGDQTVTIDAGDVPLAELPDAPVSPVEIDDGEVPLAALPKTGQTTMKLTITLMFSGIFLALTAMSKKHKEEES